MPLLVAYLHSTLQSLFPSNALPCPLWLQWAPGKTHKELRWDPYKEKLSGPPGQHQSCCVDLSGHTFYSKEFYFFSWSCKKESKTNRFYASYCWWTKAIWKAERPCGNYKTSKEDYHVTPSNKRAALKGICKVVQISPTLLTCFGKNKKNTLKSSWMTGAHEGLRVIPTFTSD